MTRACAPCVPPNGEATHCIVGFLLGVACCAAGDCTLCRAAKDRMRRSGFPEAAVLRSMAKTRRGLVSHCPTCGFPPPSAQGVAPPLPRLERLGRTVSGSWDCRICGKPLPQRRRHYCSDACWREYVRRTEMDGDEIATPTPARTYRVCVG